MTAADGARAGTLYLVATPIGNLGDITHRALEVLGSVEVVFAEDTRRSRALLTHFGISGKDLVALHAHSTPGERHAALARILGGANAALVTDAGTPAVSDPGHELVALAVAAGVSVVPIPGASAVLAALVGSGLASGSAFRFLGFLPREGADRARALAKVSMTEEPVVLYEAPNRTPRTLADLAERTPDRSVAVARELTKMHEEFVRGTLRELAKAPREWVGEVVLVLGAHEPKEVELTDEEIDARIDRDGGASHPKTLADRLAALSGRGRRELYERIVARRKGA